MGVLGLTPFLQKTCPEVIKQLPDRLRGLSGKTIVIDGTLVTQRLHFAQIPHHYRHVLGWYRIVRELNESGVSAICVFDGKERSLAKARENERRREARKLAATRESLEIERSNRLRQLVGVLGHVRNLGIGDRARVTNLLRDFNIKTHLFSKEDIPSRDHKPLILKQVQQELGSSTSLDAPPSYRVPYVQDDTPTEAVDILGTDAPCLVQTESEDECSDAYSDPAIPRDVLDDMKHLNLRPESTWLLDKLPEDDLNLISAETLLDSVDTKDPLHADNFAHEPSVVSVIDFALESTDEISLPSEHKELSANQDDLAAKPASPISSPSFIEEASAPVTQYQDQPFPMEATQPSLITPPLLSVDDIPSTLASLYLDYRNSVPKFASLSVPNMTTSLTSASSMSTEPDEHSTMTRAQYQLMLEEGKVWDDIVSSSLTVNDPSVSEPLLATVPDSALASLARKSKFMSESYHRRINPANAQTYDESKEILQALGVPCVESSGFFEAEALAASIVLNGLADYVASEDTDVLIYEAPLIRNITNRQGPLVFVSGADVREVLQLDRASYVDFALLLGTDFSQRIKNVGPTRALKFIREHGSIERVIQSETKYAPRISPEEYLAQVEVARLIFKTLPPVPEKEQLEQEKMEEGEIMQIMQRYGLGRMMMGNDDWGYGAALDGNYFADNPSAL